MRMTIEQLTDEVDMLAAHAEALYKRSQRLAVAIRDNSVPDVPGDAIEPVPPLDGITPGAYGPHGFTVADSDGFARYQALDEWLAKNVPANLRSKFPTRFCTAELWELGQFPDWIARDKCYMNLCARLTSPSGGGFNYQAWTYRFEQIPQTAEPNWNIGPLDRRDHKLERVDLLTDAWSTNWKPGGVNDLLVWLDAMLQRELAPKD